MKRNNKKLKKVILAAIAVFEILAMNVPLVFAGGGGGGSGPDVPSTSEVAGEMEERYHLNTGSLQDMGESMNVSGTKGTAPQVMLFFNPTSPKEGEKVTVTAMPMYFSNQKENLYYTWYLKRKGGSNDLEDQKLAAMRVVANGGWEPNLDTNDDGDDDITIAEFYNRAPEDSDKDGYQSKLGGNDKENMPKYCYFHDFSSGKNYELAKFADGGENLKNPRCGSENTATNSPRCGATSWNTDMDVNWNVGDVTSTETTACMSAGSDPTCVDGRAECDRGLPTCGISSGSTIDADTACADLVTPRCSTQSAPSTTCEVARGEKHLFARASATGNNTFGIVEEEAFRTNPYDADTDDDGFVDEADAAGLGQDVLSWTYQKGDKIGVAVEGTSMFTTKYSDGSMMIMWAFLGNKCETGTNGTYTQKIKGYDVNIPVTSKNLNNCLESNLVDPGDGGQAKKLEVNLTFSPDNPINDSSVDKMGDVLIVNATIDTDGADAEQIYYKWKIQYKKRMSDGNEEWKSVPQAAMDNIKIKGNNLSSLKIPLNLPVSPYFADGATYFKIRLEARENYQGASVRSGFGEAIVKINNSQQKIETYRTKVDTGDRFLTDGIICNEGLSKTVCFVVKNEVVGLRVKKDIDESPGNDINNAIWTVDGKPLECTAEISSECGTSGNYYYNYLPITKKVGERYTVNFQGMDVTSGKSVELIRTLEVVEPFVEIKSIEANVVAPRYLGAYKNISDGSEIPNFSKDVFDVLVGANGLKFQAIFHPTFIARDTKVEWLVNGEKSLENKIVESDGSNPADAVNELMSYDTLKVAGEADVVTFNARYNQPDDKRRAMQKIWGISPFEATDKYMSVAATINIIEGEAEGKGKPAGFFASLYFNLPANLIFMLKVIITSFLVIFISKLVFSLNLRRSYYNE